MRLQSLILLLPALVGFCWLVAYLFLTPRTDFFRKLKRLVAVLSFFFLFASLSSNADSRMLLHFVLFEQVCALAIVPSLISLVREYGNDKSYGLFFKLCCMIPMIHLVVGIESVFVAGFDISTDIYISSLSFNGPMFPFLDNNGQMVFYACYTYMFKAFLLTDFFLFAINVMSCAISGTCKLKNVLSFLFKGGESRLVPVIYLMSLIILLIIIPVLVLGKSCYSGLVMLTVVACILLAYVMFMLCMAGLAGQVESQSVKGILKSLRK